MAGVGRQLARNGIAAFNVNYRLAPEHLYPAQLGDVPSQKMVERIDGILDGTHCEATHNWDGVWSLKAK